MPTSRPRRRCRYVEGRAAPRDQADADSSPSQVFAPVTENSADRMRTLPTVREVATYLRVSTGTVYELCARGKLRHFRVPIVRCRSAFVCGDSHPNRVARLLDHQGG